MDLQSGFPKKTLFWKYMLVGLQGMYQEYDLYERLAKDRRFDMSRHLKKTMDRLYQAAATGYRLDDKYILTIECSYFEPRDKWEELALQIVKDLEDFFRIVYEKDCKKAGAFLKRPMQILEQFAAFSPNIDLEKATKKEQQYLAQLIQEVSAVDKSGKKACIETIKQSARPSLIGEELLEHRAPIQKEKPDKKTFPLIRRTSLRYDYDIERLKKMKELNPAQWEGTMCLEAERFWQAGIALRWKRFTRWSFLNMGIHCMEKLLIMSGILRQVFQAQWCGRMHQALRNCLRGCIIFLMIKAAKISINCCAERQTQSSMQKLIKKGI